MVHRFDHMATVVAVVCLATMVVAMVQMVVVAVFVAVVDERN